MSDCSGYTPSTLLPFPADFSDRLQSLSAAEQQDLRDRIESEPDTPSAFDLFAIACLLIEQHGWVQASAEAVVETLFRHPLNRRHPALLSAVLWTLFSIYARRDFLLGCGEHALQIIATGGEQGFVHLAFSLPELQAVTEKIADSPTLLSSLFISLFKKWGEAQPHQAVEMFEAGFRPTAPVATELLIGAFHVEELRPAILALFHRWRALEQEPFFIRSAMHLMPTLFNADLLTEDEVVQASAPYLEGHDTPNLIFAAAHAFCECWDQVNAPVGGVIDIRIDSLLTSSEPEVKAAASFALMRSADAGDRRDDFCRTFLRHNTDLDSTMKGIIESMAMVLGDVTSRDPEFTAEFLTAWIDAHPDEAIDRLFDPPNFTALLYDHTPERRRALSIVIRQLSLGNARQARIAEVLINRSGVRRLVGLDQLDDQGLMLLIRRFLAYALPEGWAFHLVMVCALWIKDRRLLKQAESALTELLERFPGHGKEFLDTYVCISPVGRKVISNLYGYYRSFVHRDYDWHLPLELAAPAQREQAYRHHSTLQQRQIHKEVEESGRFPFQQLLLKRSINRGDTILYVQQGTPGLVSTTLTSMKVEGEYPRSPLIRSELEAYRRWQRMAGEDV